MATEPDAFPGDPQRDRLASRAWDLAEAAPSGYASGPGVPPAGPRAAGHRGRRRGGPRHGRGMTAAAIALVTGIAGTGLAGYAVYTAMAPREFTPAQQRQIMAWEVAARWRELPAGDIFPATVTYDPPDALQDGGTLKLAAMRLGIARGVPCGQASDAVAAAILNRDGCQGILRSTYVDGTGAFLVTVGIAAFPGTTQASQASDALGAPQLTHSARPDALVPGVRAASFAGTPALAFTDGKRQVSGSVTGGPYLFMYTIGYADGRPKVPVDVDGYTFAEMTSMGKGVARAVARKLTLAPPVPRCPGAPGC